MSASQESDQTTTSWGSLLQKWGFRSEMFTIIIIAQIFKVFVDMSNKSYCQKFLIDYDETIKSGFG